MITDEDIVGALPADGSPMPIRALAAAVGTSVRKVGAHVERLATEGRVRIIRPTTVGAERLIARNGQSEADALRVALQQCLAIITHALGSRP